jgi:hypothetical protein
MQGLPPEDPEGYQPLPRKSPEGSPEGVVNNEVASEIGSTHSLEGFQIVSNSLEAFKLPPLRPDLHILHMNSVGEIVVVDNTGVSTEPNARSGLGDPLFHSESFMTLTHTVGTSIPHFVPLIVHDIHGNLGASPDRPMASQVPETSITYIIPLDHFTSTTSRITTVSDQILIGSQSIPTLQMAHSTMVPQATMIPTGNVVISQDPIGTPLPSRTNPSLPPGYRSLNDFVAIPSGSNPFGGTSHSFTYGYQILIGVQPQAGGGQPQFGIQTQIGAQPQLGGQPQVGFHNILYGQNTPGSQSHLWNLLSQGNTQSSGGKHPQVNSFVPPNFGQPYPSSLNPTWGQGVQSSVPYQGNPSTQPNLMG